MGTSKGKEVTEREERRFFFFFTWPLFERFGSLEGKKIKGKNIFFSLVGYKEFSGWLQKKKMVRKKK